MRRAVDASWDLPGTDLSYQFCQSAEDTLVKVHRAVDRDTNVILVVGGDGTVNSTGRALLHTDTALGIIPVGSGNGFARHFGIPLSPEKAVHALARGQDRRIDVGMVDDTPFLVTCSMAWDASLVKSFARSPVRGILPYVFAGVQEFFEYQPQDLQVVIDEEREVSFSAPMVFTIANLSQYGGGAKIAPHARPDDGLMELVVALRQDVPKLIANMGRLFDGSINRIPEVTFLRFRTLRVRRERATSMQIDGELVEAGRETAVRVMPSSLKVLVPDAPDEQA